MKAASRLALALSLAAGVVSVSSLSAAAQEVFGAVGSVFVMTNSAQGNAIQSYGRRIDGSLVSAGTYATGGNGSGGTVDPLTSQHSLLLSPDTLHLVAVNAGSGTISSFNVLGQTLRLADTKPTGGSLPNALAISGNLVYVLNSGGNGNVTGFYLNLDGSLQPIPNSTTNLSEPETDITTGASSLAISPDRQFLVVTERLTNRIDVFRIKFDGTLSSIAVNNPAGKTPFAATFAPNGALLVAEVGTNTLSSYRIQPNQSLLTLTSALPSLGRATCWDVVSFNGLFVYTANAGTANLSGFTVGPFGALNPIGNTIVGQNPAGSTNIDIAVTGPGVNAPGGFLYSLNTATGTIGSFAIGWQGTLTNLGTVPGLPASAGLNGIAAY